MATPTKTTASPAVDVVDTHASALAKTWAFINLRGKAAIEAWVETILPSLTVTDIAELSELRKVSDKDGVLQDINAVVARFLGVFAVLNLTNAIKAQKVEVIKLADKLFSKSADIEKFADEWKSLAEANDIVGLKELAKTVTEARKTEFSVDKRVEKLINDAIKELELTPAEARAAVANSLAKL